MIKVKHISTRFFANNNRTTKPMARMKRFICKTAYELQVERKSIAQLTTNVLCVDIEKQTTKLH